MFSIFAKMDVVTTVFLLIVVAYTEYATGSGSDTISFNISLFDGREITYPFNRTNDGDCLYVPEHDTVTCMTKHNYNTVVKKWRYQPKEISYISINCMQQTFYANVHHICICVNGSDAANPGKYKQHDDIHYCHFTTISGGMFNKLSSLMALDLSHNAIRKVESSALVGLTSLKYLDLSNNPIESLPDGFLCNNPNIEVLKLRNISMTTAHFHEHFLKCDKDLINLIYIDLSDNLIERMPNQLFQHIPNVQTLILRSNKIKYISESAFYGAGQLEFLDISFNRLSTMPRAFCDFLYRVRYIDLSTNIFTSFNMNDMTNCDTAENLNIANNRIKRITGTLAQRSDLKTFNASGNGIKRISENFLANATTMETIDISNNNILEMSAAVFKGLSELKHLELQHNKLVDTSDILNIFDNAEKLISLNMSSNPIRHIANDTFKRLSNLEKLDMSRNNFSVVTDNTFKGLTSLKELLLHHNTINRIDPTSFINMTSLNSLDLSHNRLGDVNNVTIPYSLQNANLEQNIFSTFPTCFDNTNVAILNLKSNVIDDMSDVNPGTLKNLRTLDLSFNQLNSFSHLAFVNMTSLTDLNLSFNDIAGNLSADMFKGTMNLTTLNFQKNYIDNINGFFASPSTKTLTRVNLSYNTIKKIIKLLSDDGTNRTDHLLRELDLQHGYISDIDQDAFLGFLNLRTVNLENNMITSLRPFNIEYGTEFKLHENPLECNCNMSWLSESYVTVQGRKISTFDYEVGKCVVFPEKLELPVRKVPKNQFRCKVENHCDSFCSCFSSNESLTIDYVNCDGLIGNMPEILSRDAKVIYLDGNRLPDLRLPNHYRTDFQTIELYLNRSQIGMIEDIFFSGFDNLEILDLSQNKISDLSKSIFSSLIKLRKLYLSDNKIQVVSASWFDGLPLQEIRLDSNKIQNVNQTVLSKFDSIHSLRYLNLHNNPYQCDCMIKDFRIWLKNYGKVVSRRYDIQCFESKRPLLSYHETEFKCAAAEAHLNNTRGIVTVIIVVGLCFVLMFAAAIYYRRDILAVVYVKLGIGCLRKKFDANRPYDAYLVYDVNDSTCTDYVSNSLLNFLEKRKNPYKIITPDRSRLLSSVIDVEFTQLKESKTCLYVINNTVMSNSWCVDCFHRAWTYARKNQNFKLIILVFGDIEINLLEEEMRVMLSKGQYITARSRSVWDRLIYELPNPEEEINSVRSDDDISENDVIIYSASSNNLDEYGSVSIHK